MGLVPKEAGRGLGAGTGVADSVSAMWVLGMGCREPRFFGRVALQH